MEFASSDGVASAAPATVPSEMLVSFTTRHAEFSIPPAALALPTRLARFGLSEVINHMLGRDQAPVPFEFLHEGVIFRSSVRELVRRLKISSEKVLALEYQPAMRAPEPGPSGYEAPDWISCVDGGFQEVALVGSYDGEARILARNNYENILCTTGRSAHSAPIKAVALINMVDSTLAITSSQDHTMGVWNVDLRGGDKQTPSMTLRCLKRGTKAKCG